MPRHATPFHDAIFCPRAIPFGRDFVKNWSKTSARSPRIPSLGLTAARIWAIEINHPSLQEEPIRLEIGSGSRYGARPAPGEATQRPQPGLVCGREPHVRVRLPHHRKGVPGKKVDVKEQDLRCPECKERKYARDGWYCGKQPSDLRRDGASTETRAVDGAGMGRKKPRNVASRGSRRPGHAKVVPAPAARDAANNPIAC